MSVVISDSLALFLLKKIDKEIEIAEDKAFTPDEREDFRTLCRLSRDLEAAIKAARATPKSPVKKGTPPPKPPSPSTKTPLPRWCKEVNIRDLLW